MSRERPHAAIDRLRYDFITAKGWREGSTLENRVMSLLSLNGLRPCDVSREYKVGSYRIDFAWPHLALGLEADGWHHRSPINASRDMERDAYLRARGWLIFRIDDTAGEESLIGQLDRVLEVVRALERSYWDGHGPGNGAARQRAAASVRLIEARRLERRERGADVTAARGLGALR